MGREDWFYVNLPAEMGTTLDEIVKREGKKYAVYDRKELVRYILRDWLMNYEEKKGLVAVRRSLKQVDGSDTPEAL